MIRPTRSCFIQHQISKKLLSFENKLICIKAEEKIDVRCLWNILPEEQAAYFRIHHLTSNSWLACNETDLIIQYSNRKGLQSRWCLHPCIQTSSVKLESLFNQNFLNLQSGDNLHMKKFEQVNELEFCWVIIYPIFDDGRKK